VLLIHPGGAGAADVHSGDPIGAQGNSVAVRDGLVVVPVQANVKTDPGQAVFFDIDGHFLGAVAVGALPDMAVFTPDGKRVLIANEGEPNDEYTTVGHGEHHRRAARGGIAHASRRRDSESLNAVKL
jgi:hypothetical protein